VRSARLPGAGKADRNSAAEIDDRDAATVRELVGELSHEGMNAILKVVDFVGPQPAQGIADIAEEVEADVIVVGTRGHWAIGGLLVGSVTQRLLHVAPCPVLSVPPVTHRNRKAPNSKLNSPLVDVSDARTKRGFRWL
jgi:nucleotide-binding universal stress UspA family protein